jgi:uncharacterized protein (TIGR04255 family)
MENRKRVRYRNPPLIEALCEFGFQETGIPSNIILGKLYEQIEGDFPTIETHRGIDVQAEEDTTSPAIVMEERTRFVSKDGTRLIQVGPGLLVANQLKPYKDYPSFRTFIQETMDVYHRVARPAGLRHIGLRYINRIEMRQNQPLEEVFHIGFRIPEIFQVFPDPYLLRMEFAYCEERDRLVVILATSDRLQDDSPNAIMLDFEYILAKPDKIDDKLLEWMDEAHARIEDAFHACLTESTLNAFEPEEV